MPRGGIEFGFLSATADSELALKFASDLPGSGGHAHRLVLELQTGMLSRAADISWLSQVRAYASAYSLMSGVTKKRNARSAISLVLTAPRMHVM